MDDLDQQTVRFKPESLDNLVKLTKFNKRELKLMYRGFKQLCPSGVVKEDKFKLIYAQFFPRGADTSGYARFVFNSFDIQRKQEINFTDFVIGLSVLTRGSIDDQLKWIFTLYDLNGDGVITRDELVKIVNSVQDLMGKFSLSPSQAAALEANKQAVLEMTTGSGGSSGNATGGNESAATSPSPRPPEVLGASTSSNSQQQDTFSFSPPVSAIEHAENLFKKFDLNNDGVITQEEFIEACHNDANIIKSISVFNTIL